MIASYLANTIAMALSKSQDLMLEKLSGQHQVCRGGGGGYIYHRRRRRIHISKSQDLMLEKLTRCVEEEEDTYIKGMCIVLHVCVCVCVCDFIDVHACETCRVCVCVCVSVCVFIYGHACVTCRECVFVRLLVVHGVARDFFLFHLLQVSRLRSKAMFPFVFNLIFCCCLQVSRFR